MSEDLRQTREVVFQTKRVLQFLEKAGWLYSEHDRSASERVSLRSALLRLESEKLFFDSERILGD